MAAAAVEREVERRYAGVNFTGDDAAWREHLDGMREELDTALKGMSEENHRQLHAQRARLAKLDREREKLLHAYYGGALPIDLLKREQGRITREREAAERQIELVSDSVIEIREVVAMALDLLEHCVDAYAKAASNLKRQWNQALFERFEVDDDGIAEAPLKEPFASLAEPELPKPASCSAANGRRRSGGSAGSRDGVSSGGGSLITDRAGAGSRAGWRSAGRPRSCHARSDGRARGRPWPGSRPDRG